MISEFSSKIVLSASLDMFGSTLIINSILFAIQVELTTFIIKNFNIDMLIFKILDHESITPGNR